MSFHHLRRCLFAILAVLSLSACSATDGSSPPSRDYSASGGSTSCNADTLKTSIGKSGDDSTISSLLKRSGAQSSRVLKHNAHYTTDYDPNRLNIRLDESASIANIYCG
ncbi:I78 family peptidase inhibitor [Paenalcaligenes niemegkensis]|uniref:I78 family peptidase inhibitor n=1 Tax=Paenalcaligenes niemegkensis TaxID=2895469 RepID=UPI001EE8935A|nr:I78 family peptidase inhibitor [Paenalcaligenes niemegkensis]MCQ9615691.1 I78 family peptidase inhibitor [Paenalcaligenes niemegkensis]